ncbi:MAG: aspartate kinase [Prevotellaceae bacterium]|jgi:aspartate kinase|nr:aspartate kinase [Prevotellaceae bacterium]
MLVVEKYGGSSVATIEKIKNIAAHLVERKKQGDQIVVVASAMGKTTNQLIEESKQVSDKVHPRELDALLALGEAKTVPLLAMAVQDLGEDAISLTSTQIGLRATSRHQRAQIKYIDATRIKRHLAEGKIVIVAGFQGTNDEGDIVTLGRGGSDTSAVALAAILQCPCEIYTDVNGLYSVDPRKYPAAQKLDAASYDLVMEMANQGSKVMEPRSVEIAKKYNVHLYIGQSLQPKPKYGTIVMDNQLTLEEKLVSGISINENVSMITVRNIPSNSNITCKIFNLINKYELNVDMINQSIGINNNLVLTFSCNKDDAHLVDKLVQENSDIFQNLTVDKQYDNLVKLSLVGVGMASHFGVAARVFGILDKIGVPFYHVTTSEITIAVTIDAAKTGDAIPALASEFNL